MKRFKELILTKDKLFDVTDGVTELRVLNCELEWGFKMTQKEKDYLIDQQNERNG